MKCEYILFLLLLAGGTVKVKAQQQIRGHVQNEKTKTPIAGAAVYINTLKTGSITDMRGL